MTRSIIKPIIFGVLLGAIAFFAPFFLVKGLFFFLFIGFIFRMIWWGSYRRGNHFRYQMVMADKIRSMSDEEYNAMKTKFEDCDHRSYGACYGRGHYDRGCNSNYKGCDDGTETKSDTNSEKK